MITTVFQPVGIAWLAASAVLAVTALYLRSRPSKKDRFTAPLGCLPVMRGRFLNMLVDMYIYKPVSVTTGGSLCRRWPLGSPSLAIHFNTSSWGLTAECRTTKSTAMCTGLRPSVLAQQQHWQLQPEVLSVLPSNLLATSFSKQKRPAIQVISAWGASDPCRRR